MAERTPLDPMALPGIPLSDTHRAPRALPHPSSAQLVPGQAGQRPCHPFPELANMWASHGQQEDRQGPGTPCAAQVGEQADMEQNCLAVQGHPPGGTFL